MMVDDVHIDQMESANVKIIVAFYISQKHSKIFNGQKDNPYSFAINFTSLKSN